MQILQDDLNVEETELNLRCAAEVENDWGKEELGPGTGSGGSGYRDMEYSCMADWCVMET